MVTRLFICMLALACLFARFHCALEQVDLVAACEDGHCHSEESHDQDCSGCPDLESNSTSMARKAAAPDPLSYILNVWATRHLSELILLSPTPLGPTSGSPPPRDSRGSSYREAMTSHSISLRGPPAHA